LNERGIEPKIVRYLQDPPSHQQIDSILRGLDFEPRQLMRRNEKEYKELELDNPALSRDQLIAAMVATPKLIERPIVIANGSGQLSSG